MSGKGDPIAGDAAALWGLRATGVPAAWSSGPFVARVEVARRHLAPVTDVAVLAASFGREASNRATAGRTASIGPGAVRVAYAIRWLEISTGLCMPPWPEWSEPCTPGR